MNICGVLVHAAPAAVETLKSSLATFDGVEVHQSSADGRIVVTVEDTPARTAIDTIRDINSLNGIVATSLVYHQFDPAISAGTEIH